MAEATVCDQPTFAMRFRPSAAGRLWHAQGQPTARCGRVLPCQTSAKRSANVHNHHAPLPLTHCHSCTIWRGSLLPPHPMQRGGHRCLSQVKRAFAHATHNCPPAGGAHRPNICLPIMASGAETRLLRPKLVAQLALGLPESLIRLGTNRGQRPQ
jgi:hypothetical protein